MDLFTRSYDREWNRIVDMIVFNDKGISQYINDRATFKFVLLEKGEITIGKENDEKTLKAPAFFLLSEKDSFECRCGKNVKTTTVYFKPTVIREEFTFENINLNDKSRLKEGSPLYQDCFLISGFVETKDPFYLKEIPSTVFLKIKGMTDSIKNELVMQKDGFWPCRSRSYLLELLYFICYNYVRKVGDNAPISDTDMEFDVISEYLRENINENITLEKLTKDLSINRNRLNEIFNTKTSMTCLNYLTKLRMELASILLVETDLRVGEICQRIGYDDSNYFTKTFKKEMGKTPTEYRKLQRIN